MAESQTTKEAGGLGPWTDEKERLYGNPPHPPQTTDNALRWDLYSDEEIYARISQLDRTIADTDRYLNSLRSERIDLKLLLKSRGRADGK